MQASRWLRRVDPLTALLLNVAGGMITAGILWALHVSWTSTVIGALTVTTALGAYSLFQNGRIRLAKNLAPVGVVGIWNDNAAFEAARSMSFQWYCRGLVAATPNGQTVRILGFDWNELLGDTPTLGDYLDRPDGSRITFHVILMDAESPGVKAKRTAEMTWADEAGQGIYPEGRSTESIERLARKIRNCLGVATILAGNHPRTFRLKTTTVPPQISVLMNDDRGIAVFHSPYHKGKDSPIVEFVKIAVTDSGPRREALFGRGLYGFLMRISKPLGRIRIGSFLKTQSRIKSLNHIFLGCR